MQPWTNRWPGMTMGNGVSFREHGTWWQQGKPWIDYITLQFLLATGPRRGGRRVFTGRKRAGGHARCNPGAAAGYDYDPLPDVLLHGGGTNGRITLASGASYACDLVPPTSEHDAAMLECIHEVVRAGRDRRRPGPANSAEPRRLSMQCARKKIADEFGANVTAAMCWKIPAAKAASSGARP